MKNEIRTAGLLIDDKNIQQKRNHFIKNSEDMQQALVDIREYVSKYKPIDKELIVSKIDKVGLGDEK